MYCEMMKQNDLKNFATQRAVQRSVMTVMDPVHDALPHSRTLSLGAYHSVPTTFGAGWRNTRLRPPVHCRGSGYAWNRHLRDQVRHPENCELHKHEICSNKQSEPLTRSPGAKLSRTKEQNRLSRKHASAHTHKKTPGSVNMYPASAAGW